MTLALAFDPDSPYLHAHNAWMLAERGDIDEAKAELAVANSLKPPSAYVPYVESLLAAKQERWQAAAAAAQRAIDLEPDLVEAYPDLVRYERELGDLKAARATLERMAELWPLNPHPHLELGELAMEEGDSQEAITHYKRLVKLRPRVTSGYHKLASAYAQVEDLESAYEVFVECTDARTRTAGCWFQRVLIARQRATNASEPTDTGLAASVHDEIREMAGALASQPDLASVAASRMVSAANLEILQAFVDACAERRPLLRELNYYVGLLHERRGSRDAAVEAFSLVPVGSRYLVESRSKLGILLSEAGEHERALKAIAEAIAAEPSVVELRTLQSALYERAHRPADALKSLEGAITIAPERPELHHRASVLAWEMGETARAQSALERVLELNPDDVTALSLLALMLAEGNADLLRAEKLALQAKSLREHDSGVLDALGWVYFRMNRIDDAVATLEKAVEISPGRADVLGHLGDAYRKAGQDDLALQVYERAEDKCKDPAARASLGRKIAKLRASQ
jgi:tetratricopeptide (TPR) repeat protein